MVFINSLHITPKIQMMVIQTESELKAAFNAFDKLIAEMGEDVEKQAQARLLAEAIQAYEKENVHFPPVTKK